MRIVIAVDGSEDAHAAATLLGRIPLPPETEVVALGVVPEITTMMPLAPIDPVALDEVRKTLSERAREHVESAVEELRPLGWTLRAEVREGDPASVVAAFADGIGADLVVVGSRGTGKVARFPIGGVTAKLLHYSRASVLVARHGSAGDGGGQAAPAGSPERLRIIVAFDGTPASRAAVEFLASLPLGERAEVTVVSVLELITGYRMDIVEKLSPFWEEEKAARSAALETAAGRIREATPAVRTVLLEASSASTEILDLAGRTRADLIVAGRRGDAGIERFLLGSTTKRLVHHAPCSVLVVRAEDASPQV